MKKRGLEERLGYSFVDASLLNLALTHSSFGSPNNQRLEFLGDAVLQLCISERLYSENPDWLEGKLTRQRALIVQERSLHAAAVYLELSDSLTLGRGEIISGGKLRPSILADAVEALIGAVYLDSGLEQAKAFIGRLFSNIDSSEWQDYKTELQEYVQGQGASMLVYEIISSDGPAHDVRITSRVIIDGKEAGVGVGRSRKDAEQAAAKKAMEGLEKG